MLPHFTHFRTLVPRPNGLVSSGNLHYRLFLYSGSLPPPTAWKIHYMFILTCVNPYLVESDLQRLNRKLSNYFVESIIHSRLKHKQGKLYAQNLFWKLYSFKLLAIFPEHDEK